MAEAEAVYMGGASPRQQETPCERLLSAGPWPLAFREAPAGVSGDEDCWLGPQAGSREPR